MDFVKVEFEKEELYHYTSISALKSIVENRTLRLSDWRFMNDINELTYGIRLANEILDGSYPYEALTKSMLANISNSISHYYPLERIEDNVAHLTDTEGKDTRVYMFSLTHLPDDLPMWTLYGKNGCRIKINSDALFSMFHQIQIALVDKGFINVIRGSITYGEEAKRQLKESLRWTIPEKELELNGYNLLYQTIATKKEEKFSYEKEYRIALRLMDSWFSPEGTIEIEGKSKLKKVFLEKQAP